MTETAKTVDQALAALWSLGRDGPATSSELAERLQLNRTVCHRLMSTCEQRGFVKRSERGWELGAAIAALNASFETDVRSAVQPALKRLARASGETAVLSVPEGDQAVAVDQVLATTQLVQVRYQPGFRHPLSLGAHGKAILAWADDDLRDRALRSAPDAAALLAQLTTIREHGVAITRNELEFGAYGIAAPVFAADGDVCASLGIVAPLERLPATEAVEASSVKLVRDVAAEASEQLRPDREADTVASG